MGDLVINTNAFNKNTQNNQEEIIEDTNQEELFKEQEQTEENVDLGNIKILNYNDEPKKSLSKYFIVGGLLILGGITFSVFNHKPQVGTTLVNNQNVEEFKLGEQDIKIKVDENKITQLNIEVNEDQRKLTLVKPKKENKTITTKVVKPEPLNRIHIVKSGDSLYEIGLKYDISYKKLMELNGKKNTRLKIGEKIYIDNFDNKLDNIIPKVVEKPKQIIKELPRKEVKKIEKVVDKKVKDIKSLFESSKKVEYIVKPGDTLFGIAKKFNTSVQNIKISSNKSNNSLKIGEKLYF
jgi:LysM repeat protein